MIKRRRIRICDMIRSHRLSLQLQMELRLALEILTEAVCPGSHAATQKAGLWVFSLPFQATVFHAWHLLETKKMIVIYDSLSGLGPLLYLANPAKPTFTAPSRAQISSPKLEMLRI